MMLHKKSREIENYEFFFQDNVAARILYLLQPDE